ncbi:MAG: hypothetical protein IPK85_02670 [Gemmatimonadetes bacterium]|nr:hypothetical protein [Gemmatimonadota bacterium]
MADYDLGTAHGRIVVDYHDKGTGQAGKDLDGLKARAAALLKQFQETSSKYVKSAQNMASQGTSLLGRLGAAHRNLGQNASQLTDDITRLSRTIGIFAGGLAVVAPLLTRTASGAATLKGGMHIVSSFGLALGAVPKGAEGFPNVIKKIIQLSAAVSLFAGSTSLIATATKRFGALGAVGGLIGKFGGAVNSAAGPLHAVAGIAGKAAFAILQFRFVKSIIKPVLMFNGALGGLGIALHVVAGLVTSVKDLSGAVGLLPAVLGAAVFGIAALKIATMGLKDAFKAWDDPAKFAEALKKLHPEAAKTVLAIKSLEGAFKDAQKRLQGRLFTGLAQEVQALGKTYMPILESAFGRVLDSVNLAGKQVITFLRSTEGIRQSKSIVGDFAGVWGNVLSAVEPLVEVLLDVVEVGAKVLNDLTRGAGRAARSFANFVDEARKSGKLEQWIRKGVDAVKDLWAIVVNVGRALRGIWRGLNGGEAKSFLATLRDMTARFNEFIQSAEGQRILGLLGGQLDKLAANAQKLGDAFVKYVLPVLEKFLPIMTALSGGVIDGIITGMKILSPIFLALAAALTPIAPLLGYILSGMVAFAVVVGGLAVAAKIAGGAILILKSGLDTVKGAMSVAGFATRLLTGNLKAAELQALRFAGAIGKNAVKGIYTFVRSSALIKGLGIVAALAAITVAADNLLPEADQSKLDRSALGSLPDYLNQSRQDLSDYADFVRGILTDPSAELGKQQADIRSEVDQTGATWRAGKAPIQEWFRTVKESFQTDFLDVMTGLPGKIGGWLSGVGESFNTSLVVPIKAAAARVKESFMTDFVGFFTTTLPQSITGGLTTLRTTIQTKWNELAGDAQGVPERIMHALGSLTGIFLTWVTTNWGILKTNIQTKWNEIVEETKTLPGRIGAALTTLGETLWQKAVEAWQRFKDGANQKVGEAEGEARAVPGRVGSAISGLAQELWNKAVEAWNRFKAAAQQKINEALADIRAFPGKAAAAISALAQQLWQKAQEAWQRFKAAAAGKMNEAIADVRALPGRLVAALGNVGSALYQSGVNFIDGFKRGIDAAKARVLASVQAFMAGLRAYFPFSPAKKGPFSGRGYTSYSGKALVEDFANGMLSNKNMIQSAASAAMRAANLSGSFNLSGTAAVARSATAGLAAAPPALAGPLPGGSDGSSAPVTNNYNVTVPARDIAEMKNVADFFGKVQQKARAGRAA